MSVLSELNTLLTPILPVETGVFSGVPPDEYLVLTPLADDFALFGDNVPLTDVSEVRISLFSKSNYLQRKRQPSGVKGVTGAGLSPRRLGAGICGAMVFSPL